MSLNERPVGPRMSPSIIRPACCCTVDVCTAHRTGLVAYVLPAGPHSWLAPQAEEEAIKAKARGPTNGPFGLVGYYVRACFDKLVEPSYTH